MSGDEADSDFLNGLKELGLYDGDASDKPKKPSKKKSNQKKRPPRAKPLNIDALLDGVDFESAPKPPRSPINNVVPQYSKAYHSDQTTALESSIVYYLERSLKAVADDFLMQLDNSFHSNDQFDQIVDNFIYNLQNSIKEDLNLSTGKLDTTSLLHTFDLYESQFNKTFQEIRDFTSMNSKKFSTGTLALVLTKKNSMKEQLQIDELTNEIEEMTQIRTNISSDRINMQVRQSRLMKQLLDLQYKNDLLKLQIEDVHSKSSKFQNNADKFTSFVDEVDLPVLANRIRQIKEQISMLSKKNFKFAVDSIKEARNKNEMIRQIHQNQIYALTMNLNTNTSLIPQVMERTIESHPEIKNASHHRSRNHSSPRKAEMTEGFKQKLKRIERGRAEAIHEANTFVADVIKREKKNARINASRIPEITELSIYPEFL